MPPERRTAHAQTRLTLRSRMANESRYLSAEEGLALALNIRTGCVFRAGRSG